MPAPTTWAVRPASQGPPAELRMLRPGPPGRAAELTDEPLGMLFAWALAVTGAVITAEGAIPLSPSDRVLLWASSVPMAAVVALAAVLVVLGRVRREVPAMLGPWLFLVSFAALSTMWSVAASDTVEAVLVLASVATFLAAVVAVEHSPVVFRMVRTGVVAGGGAGALWGLVGFATGTLPVGGDGAARFSAIDAPNATAAALLLPLVLALDRALACRARGDARGARLASLLAALILVGILITGSRGGLVAAGVGLLVVAIVRGARVRRGAILVLVVVGLAFALAPSGLQTRLTATHSTGRTGLWELGLEACEEHCVIGGGYGSFPSIYGETFRTTPDASGYHDDEFKAHNIWLEAAVEIGLAGVVLLLVAVALTVRHAWRAPPELRASALGALVAVLVATMFLSHLPFRYFWLVLVYVALALPGGRVGTADGST